MNRRFGGQLCQARCNQVVLKLQAIREQRQRCKLASLPQRVLLERERLIVRGDPGIPNEHATGVSQLIGNDTSDTLTTRRGSQTLISSGSVVANWRRVRGLSNGRF